MTLSVSVSQDLSSVFDAEDARLDRAKRMVECMVEPLRGSFSSTSGMLTLTEPGTMAAEPWRRAHVILPMALETAEKFAAWMRESRPSYEQDVEP